MLVLACGAIAREVLAVIRLNGWTNVTVRCLPAKLHSTPQKIPDAVDAKLHELAGRYERVFVAYADCGTGGALDPVLERHGVERLPGAHCYGFLAGNDVWDAIHEEDPATFYLTDFLARHFDALVDPRAQAGRPSGARADDVRQLQAARLPGADRRPRPARPAPARLPSGSAWRSSTAAPGYGDLVPALTRFVEGGRPHAA